MMKQDIEGIQAITFSTDPWEEAAKFYSDWGLSKVAMTNDLQQWQTMNGAEVNVVRPDPMGLRIKFVVNKKIPLAILGAASNPWGCPSRIDTASLVYAKAEQIEIGHVVLFTTQLYAMEAFYAGLGFITSDRYPGRGVFMRCAADGGHHLSKS
jgi:hypothetical protein